MEHRCLMVFAQNVDTNMSYEDKKRHLKMLQKKVRKLKKEIKDSDDLKTKRSDSKYPSFYCTVCKMKTWKYHSHSGLNTSKTIDKVKNKSEISNAEN